MGDRFVFLHNRAVPGTRGNIDHIAVGDSVLSVIDTKAWAGRVAARHVGGLFRGTEHLYVGAATLARRSKATGGRSRPPPRRSPAPGRCHARAGALASSERTRGFAKPLVFGDVLVVWPTKLPELLRSHQIVDAHRRDEIAARSSVRLASTHERGYRARGLKGVDF